MSAPRFGRRDATEPAILRALAKAGADYILWDVVDVVVLFRGAVHLLDCKVLKGRKTRNQQILLQRGWPVHFVITPEDALKAIGALHG